MQFGFPVLIMTWMLLSFYCFIGTDSIMYNLSVGRDAEAEILIKKVYDCNKESSDEVLRVLKTQVKRKSKNEAEDTFYSQVFS